MRIIRIGGKEMFNKKMNGLMVFILVLSLLLVGCSAKSNEMSTMSDGKIKVYTSFYVMYDFAIKIGGDKVSITNLVPAGTEPHDWEPNPSDIVNLEKGDVFIYNGAGFEAWTEKVLKSLQNDQLIVVETSNGLELLPNEHEDEELEFDPHVWLNPMLAKQQMAAIKNAFAEVDPSNKEYYEKNYQNYAKMFDDLNAEFTETIGKYTKKDIVVAHEAFGYLCNAYGLNQVGIEGLSADSEPSPARMAEITKFAKENDVKYIFFEELVSPKIAETIAREVGAQTAVLNPLEGLDEEAIEAGKDYFSVMRENLEALSKALQ